MLNNLGRLREKKGFTLVELIVVIAIIAILTAVIVPLVGRYSAQAAYVPLQDAAKDISNSSNAIISEVAVKGSVMTDLTVEGVKVSNSLGITVKDASGADKSSDHADFIAKLRSALQEALPNGASFIATIGNSTVTGVVYSTRLGIDDLDGTVVRNRNFTDAFEIGGIPVGAAGNKIVT